jgi:hypothetical protein
VLDLAVKGDGRGLLLGFFFAHDTIIRWRWRLSWNITNAN